ATFPCWTETSYHKVDKEPHDSGSIEEKLQRSRTALAKIRPRSRVHAPINTLPSEILASILAASAAGPASHRLTPCLAPSLPPGQASVPNGGSFTTGGISPHRTLISLLTRGSEALTIIMLKA
ncbi:hypothetical protein FRC08_007991, partial [Ceratobasidium sp. 394]